MRMMLRNDEELKGPSRRNKGGAYKRKGTFADEESMLQYLRSILQVVDKENSRNLKWYPQCGQNERTKSRVKKGLQVRNLLYIIA